MLQVGGMAASSFPLGSGHGAPRGRQDAGPSSRVRRISLWDAAGRKFVVCPRFSEGGEERSCAVGKRSVGVQAQEVGEACDGEIPVPSPRVCLCERKECVCECGVDAESLAQLTDGVAVSMELEVTVAKRGLDSGVGGCAAQGGLVVFGRLGPVAAVLRDEGEVEV